MKHARALFLLVISFILTASSSAETQPSRSLVTAKLAFPATGAASPKDQTAFLTSGGDFRVSWRLAESSPEKLVYLRDKDQFAYETPNGPRAVLLSGERVPPLQVPPAAASSALPDHILAKEREIVSAEKNREWRYRLPGDRRLMAESLHADERGNLFFQDDGHRFYSLNNKGEVRFLFSLSESASPPECRAAPNGDAVCISSGIGVIGIRAMTDSPRIWIDGRERFFAQPPVLREDTVYVPLRGLFEAMSADVRWDAVNRTVTAERKDRKVRLTAGSSTAFIDGRKVTIRQTPYIENGTFMVPLRFAGEALGSLIVWEASTYTIQAASR